MQTPPGCVASLPLAPDRGALLIALNLRNEAMEVDLTTRDGAAREARDLVADQPLAMGEGGRLKLAFRPYESRVLWLLT
ncbi:MAG: hypothetical protein FJX75_10835 [Armatimonadetes bacterium]|nr:hypothetical protein [Armatimonadota bacterium]